MWNLPDLFFVLFVTRAVLCRASLPVGVRPELEGITLEEAETVRGPTGGWDGSAAFLHLLLAYRLIACWSAAIPTRISPNDGGV